MARRILTGFAESRETVVISLILAGALAVRLLGVSRGLPYIHEWDEPAILTYVIEMLQRGDLNPNTGVYPSVYYYMLLPVMYVHYVFLHVHGLLLSPWGIQLHHPQAPPTYWFYTNYPSFYLWARMFTACLGAATVYVVYRIGRIAYGPPVGLLAGALLAVAPGAVYYADTVRVDIPMVFFATLTVLLGLNVLRRGARRDYALAGLLAGLATSTKESAVVLAFPLVIAHLLNPQRKHLVDLNLLIMGLCSLVGALAGTPYLLVKGVVREQMITTVLNTSGHPSLSMLKTSLPRYLGYFVHRSQGDEWYVIPHTAFGLVPTIAALLGFIVGFRWAPRLHLYLISFPLLFIFLTAVQPSVVLRYMVPVLPFAVLLAAAGSVWLWQRLPVRWPGKRAGWYLLLAGLGIAILLAGPAFDSLRLAWSMGHRPDTRTAAVAWLRQHVAPGVRVAFEEDLRWYFPALEHQPFQVLFVTQTAGLGWYSQHSIDYALVGEKNPLRNLPTVATFPRPPYVYTGDWTLDTYPVIDPAITVVDIGKALPVDRATQFPRQITPIEMLSEPAQSPTPGTIVSLVRLPGLRVSPGRYALSVTAAWQPPPWLPPLALHQYRIRVLAGDRPVGEFEVDAPTPRTYTTPPFEITSDQVLPLRLVEELQGSVWTLHPTKDRCARVPDASDLNSQQFTVEAWIFMHQLHHTSPSNEERETRILSKNAEAGYTLRIDGQKEERTWKLQLALAGNWSAVTGWIGTGPMGSSGQIPMGEWVHVAATADGHRAQTYINGEPVATAVSGNPTDAYQGPIRSTGSPLFIGCLAVYDDWFDGAIGDVRVWNYARSPAEIRGSMAAPPAAGAPGLVAAWSFDTVTPDGRIPDVSGHGHDIPDAAALSRVLEPLTLSTRQHDREALGLPVPTQVVVQRLP